MKAVHRDVTALPTVGLLRKADAGQVEFPFDAIKVDVRLRGGVKYRPRPAGFLRILTVSCCQQKTPPDFSCGVLVSDVVYAILLCP